MQKKCLLCKGKRKGNLAKQKEEDAGYDLYACIDDDYIEIKPTETKLVPTGIAWASSPKFYMQIEERSSTGSKGIKRNAGIIDSGYRGEIKIAIYNSTKNTLIISNIEEKELRDKYDLPKEILLYSTKKAIAQGVIHRVEKMKVKTLSYDELLKIPSSRGDKGFGSTNKN